MSTTIAARLDTDRIVELVNLALRVVKDDSVQSALAVAGADCARAARSIGQAVGVLIAAWQREVRA